MVLMIVTIMGALVAPALVRFGADRPAGTADALLGLLHDARKVAIDNNVTSVLRIDPRTAHYRVDTTGILGTGEFADGKLDIGSTQVMVTDQPRLRYIFWPSGAAFADSVIVRGGPTPLWIGVDPWSGVANAEAR